MTYICVRIGFNFRICLYLLIFIHIRIYDPRTENKKISMETAYQNRLKLLKSILHFKDRQFKEQIILLR